MRPQQSLLLVFCVLTEIPIAMIILSRVLPRASNRIANLVAAPITILWVIGGGTLSASYVFFAAMEVVCMVIIMRTAWTWRMPSVQGETVRDA